MARRASKSARIGVGDRFEVADPASPFKDRKFTCRKVINPKMSGEPTLHLGRMICFAVDKVDHAVPEEWCRKL